MSGSSRGEAVDAQYASYRTSSPTAAEFGGPGSRGVIGTLLAALPLVALVLSVLAPELVVGAVLGLVVGVALVPVGIRLRRALRDRRSRTGRRESLH